MIGFALALGLLAMAGGLVEWLASGRTNDLGIALAQLPLVVLSLLAGWAIAERVGWVPLGIGATTFLTTGAARSLRDFGVGFLLAAPWALGNIANGPFEEDSFRAGWQVFAALHPITALCPGPVATEFAAVAGCPRRTSRNPLMRVASAAAVAAAGWRGLAAGKPVVVPDLLTRIGLQSLRVLPLQVIARTSRTRRPAEQFGAGVGGT